MYTEITSRANAKIKYAAHLAESAAFRAEEGLFFAEGKKLCLDLAARFACRTVFFTEKALRDAPALESLAPESYLLAPPVAEKLSETKSTQGVFALLETPCHTLADICLPQGVLVCETLQDPANVGAVLRTAAGLGWGGVVLAAGCADAFSPKALRASMGGAGRVPVVQAKSAAAACEALRAAGGVVYAAALQGAKPLAAVPLRCPPVLLIGNEGAGLSQEALRAADESVFLPMQNGVESLNAAAAAAILMYYFGNNGV